MGASRGWAVGAVLAVAAVAGPAWAQDHNGQAQDQGQGWETIAHGPIVVKVRPIPGTPSREVWAEGVLEAEVQDLQSAILDADAYPRFMPYVKEARTLEHGPDGTLYYARLEPPLITPRDYIVKMQVHKRTGPDGEGEFANAWRSEPDRLPKKPSVGRLPICDGSWKVTRAGPGRSKVVYRASVDPGGWMPSFISDLANKSGASGTMRAVEREAQRRGEARKAQAANAPRQQPTATH